MKPVHENCETWEQADGTLKELAGIKRRVERAEARYDRAVEACKADLVTETKADLDRREVLERRLEAFTRLHRKDMKGQSRKLNFGKVGFRKATKLQLAQDEQATINELVRLGFTGCIRTKSSLDKGELGKLGDADLEAVGVVRSTDEAFYYEPASDEVQTTTTTTTAKAEVRS